MNECSLFSLAVRIISCIRVKLTSRLKFDLTKQCQYRNSAFPCFSYSYNRRQNQLDTSQNDEYDDL